MESFNSLKFWRKAAAPTVPASGDVTPKASFVDEDSDFDDDDSFFDLEFTSPHLYSSNMPCHLQSPDFVESPRDVFCNGKVFPFDSNVSKPQSPISLLRSAPKFKVFMLGFKKTKPETDGASPASPKKLSRKSSGVGQSKRFSVNCTVEEVPVFSRDNSLRSKLLRETFEDNSVNDSLNKSEKDVPKYLKLIKPLYSIASKRYSAEKMKFPDQPYVVSPMSSPASVGSFSPRKFPEEKQGNNRASGLKVVCKSLGKSRSAPSPVRTPVHRRDDSLLQNDGIQGAILHCKRSYSSSTGKATATGAGEASEERKRCSI